MSFLLSSAQSPDWLEYPRDLVAMIDQGRTDITPWHILETERVLKISAYIKETYQREVVAFAARQDNDDVACFEQSRPEQVVVIHCFASKGWETERLFESFDVWLRDAEEDANWWTS